MGWFSFAAAPITAASVLSDFEAIKSTAVSLEQILAKSSGPIGFFEAIRIAKRADAIGAAMLTATTNLKQLEPALMEKEAEELLARVRSLAPVFAAAVEGVAAVKSSFDRLKVAFVVEFKVKWLADLNKDLQAVIADAMPSREQKADAKVISTEITTSLAKCAEIYAGSAVHELPSETQPNEVEPVA